jgi:hypothetical protein
LWFVSPVYAEHPQTLDAGHGSEKDSGRVKETEGGIERGMNDEIGI